MISHKFKCVFVHVPKTAGQSVEQFFKEKLEVNEKYCEELLITKNDDPAKGPARLAHLRSEEYVACGHLDEDAYQHYFTFGFVRVLYVTFKSCLQTDLTTSKTSINV